MDPVEDRAQKLAKNFLNKARRVDSISVETIDKYEVNHVRDNGPYWKPANRPTVLGHLDQRYTSKRAEWEANNTITPHQSHNN